MTEVIVGIQFADIEGLTTPYVGLLWQRFRSRYPKAKEQAPVEATFEVFGTPRPRAMAGQISFQVQALLTPPFPRYQFETADGHEMFQIQPNRIWHNWMQKGDTTCKYPRFEHVRAAFLRDIDDFIDFLKAEGFSAPQPNQAEVTYINTVTLAEGADPHREVSRIMTIANAWPKGTDDLPVLENTVIKSQAILHRNGQPTCRLHLTLQPVIISKTGAAAIQLDLTARGKPNGDSLHDAFELIDFAHCGIVNTFTAITTKDMHQVWDRKDGR